MKLLIAGGYGQLGSEFSALDSTALQCIRLSSAELDISNAKQVQQQIATHKPNAVINAAAYTNVDKAEQEHELAYAINRDGIANLAQCCAANNIPLLHVSTDYVFSGKQSQPYSEQDQTDPQGVYGASKLAGEEALRNIWEKHLILRVSWVFGQYGSNFVKTMLRVGAERDELNVVADQLGAPTAARSIARNLVAIAQHAIETERGEDQQAIWGTYHFPSQPFTSWHGFAEQIFARALANKKLTKAPTLHAISTAQYPTPAVRPANSQMITVKPLPCIIPCDWQQELDEVLRQL